MKIISAILIILFVNISVSQSLLFQGASDGDPKDYKIIRVGMTKVMVLSILKHMRITKSMSYFDPVSKYETPDGTVIKMRFSPKAWNYDQLTEIEVIEPDSKNSESFKVEQYFITPTEQGR